MILGFGINVGPLRIGNTCILTMRSAADEGRATTRITRGHRLFDPAKRFTKSPVNRCRAADRTAGFARGRRSCHCWKTTAGVTVGLSGRGTDIDRAAVTSRILRDETARNC